MQNSVHNQRCKQLQFGEKTLLVCGDISSNPGPKGNKVPPKYPCGECDKAVRNNQDAILCSTCFNWFHAKCLNMTLSIFHYYLNKPDIEWTCPTCALPTLKDSFFEVVTGEDMINETEGGKQDQTQMLIEVAPEHTLEREVDNISDTNEQMVHFRKHHNKAFLIAHLNINSIQNKFEELTDIIKKSNTHIIFVSETNIDPSYPNAQFTIPGFSLYRNDRKKGGGGILALVSTSLIKSRLKLDKNYKTIISNRQCITRTVKQY